MATGPHIDRLCDQITDYLTDLSNFFTARSLKISAVKSTATLFTTWTKEVGLELDVFVDGEKIPTTNHPKILGLTFDTLFSFSAHATATCNKLRARNSARDLQGIWPVSGKLRGTSEDGGDKRHPVEESPNLPERSYTYGYRLSSHCTVAATTTTTRRARNPERISEHRSKGRGDYVIVYDTKP
ncbi:PREDICTED: uncharacterized protein LOC108362983 [Rhagoletis zephyria]|uniref:uncharacterized protein LOC108362983 n=1 Tax=Rhagoletis zephyria TaxID=28612 RepID=UPI0008115DDD|nr:PREDICTED: uncharacterized protein LOC108362983 [Rhagoletis zephyria]